MIIYPTSENRTVSGFQPAFTWCLLLFSLVGFLAIHIPSKITYQKERQVRVEAIRQALTQQLELGQISEAIFIRAQEDVNLIGDPSYRNNFPKPVHDRFQHLQDLPRPLETWLQRDLPTQLIYAVMPHHWVLLLLVFVCLPPLGFIFEHLYDRLIYAGLFLFIAPAWVVLAERFDSPFLPSPLLSWSMTMAVLIAVFYTVAPRNLVTLTFRTWFFRNIEARITVPTILFPAIYFLGLSAVNLRLSEYQNYFSAEQLASAAIVGGLLGLIIMVLPNRDQVLDNNPKTQINQQLARAELFFDEQQREKAVETLRELLELDPELHQVQRIADIAWEHHQTDLAERAFKIVLRKTLSLDDFDRTFQTVETMVFHNLSVPDSVLLKTMEKGIKKGRIDQVRKLIPYAEDKPSMDPKAILSLQERLVTVLFDQYQPDRETLYEMKLWFEANFPQSGACAKIDHFLNQHSTEAGLTDNYTPAPQVHRHLKISLIAVTSNHLRIQTPDKVEKTVPWTAILGCFGSRSEEGPEFFGAILVQFKRKIFSCNFTNRDILVRNEQGELLGFPSTWELLRKCGVSHLPFLHLEEFETVPNETAFRLAAEEFANQYLN